jgi:PAS domain S-box-containing protein
MESEDALLAALVRTSEDAIISLSTDFRITSWNRGAQKLLGYTAEEAIGKRPFDLYIPSGERAMDQARLTRDLAMIRKNPEAVRLLELPLQRKDGTILDAAIGGSGIYDAHGELVGLSAIVRDVTERRRIERQSAALAAIVESSDDAITTIAPDLRITYWNRGAERMFGFTAAESIGQSFTRNIAPERHAWAREIVERLMARPDEVVRFEGPNHRKDGTLIEASTVCFAIRDAEGKVVALSSIQRDISGRIRSER